MWVIHFKKFFFSVKAIRAYTTLAVPPLKTGCRHRRPLRFGWRILYSKIVKSILMHLFKKRFTQASGTPIEFQ